MVLDSVRTLVIWGVSLAIGWQPFQALQLLGFAVLVTGMCVYNDIVIGKIILFIFVFFSACIKKLGKDLILYKSKSLKSTLIRVLRLFFSPLIPGEYNLALPDTQGPRKATFLTVFSFC